MSLYLTIDYSCFAHIQNSIVRESACNIVGVSDSMHLAISMQHDTITLNYDATHFVLVDVPLSLYIYESSPLFVCA